MTHHGETPHSNQCPYPEISAGGYTTMKSADLCVTAWCIRICLYQYNGTCSATPREQMYSLSALLHDYRKKNHPSTTKQWPTGWTCFKRCFIWRLNRMHWKRIDGSSVGGYRLFLQCYHTRSCAYQWFQGCACKVCETHRLTVKWQKPTGSSSTALVTQLCLSQCMTSQWCNHSDHCCNHSDHLITIGHQQ